MELDKAEESRPQLTAFCLEFFAGDLSQDVQFAKLALRGSLLLDSPFPDGRGFSFEIASNTFLCMACIGGDFCENAGNGVFFSGLGLPGGA